MKQGKYLAFLLALVFAATALADEPPASPPATKEDIQEVQRSIVRIHRDAEKVAKEAAKESDAARSAERQEHKDITGAISQSENAVTIAVKEQGNTVGAGLNNLNRTLRLVLISGGLLLVVGIFLGLWVLRGRGAREMEKRVTATAGAYLSANAPVHVPAEIVYSKLPKDPSPEEIKKYAEATGLESFPITVKLPKCGDVVVEGGTIRKDEHGILVIEYPGVGVMSLDNRRKAAERFFFLTSANTPKQEGTDLIQ